MTWRERLRPGRVLGYGLKGPERRMSFFWTVIFVGLFPAIWFGYLLVAIARLVAGGVMSAWRGLHAIKTLPFGSHPVLGVPQSPTKWTRPASPVDAAARHQQIILASGWFVLVVTTAIILVTVRSAAPGADVALALFAVACGTRVVAHVLTYRWMRVSSFPKTVRPS